MLILLRHGQTPHNAAALLQGDVDVALDGHGIEQAKRAGEYIRDRWHIDDVVTSPMIRARTTAEHAGFGSAAHQVDDRWREISFGEYEQLPVKDVIADLGARWNEDPGYAPVGGESLAALHSRVVAACEELIRRAEGTNILVVTHATPIKSAVAWATGGTAATVLNLWVNTGTVSVVGRAAGNLLLREFNRQID